MIFSVVGCGETASDWIPRGTSIGVNDCFKWGKPTDALLVCNRPNQFRNGRHEIITNSKATHFYTDDDYYGKLWRVHKKSMRKSLRSNNPALPEVRFLQWYGSLYKDAVFYANSSPFIAMSLAYVLGAKDIILWGVDFRNHHSFNDNNPGTKIEIRAYMELISALKEQGVNVWLGKEGTAFDSKLIVYDERGV